MLLHLAFVAAIALLWGRVVGLHAGWPTWLVFGALAAAFAVAGAQQGWAIPMRPALAVVALGVEYLAERQLANSAAHRPRLWWATMGGAAALAALASPGLAPIALGGLAWRTSKTRQASTISRWGASAMVLTGVVAWVGLGGAAAPAWPPLVGVPRLPTSSEVAALLDVFGALGVVLAVVGVGVAVGHAPGPSVLVGATLICFSPLPWLAPWQLSWPWAFAAIISAVLAIGWLATRAERPSHRVALWSALVGVSTAFAWVPPLL